MVQGKGGGKRPTEDNCCQATSRVAARLACHSPPASSPRTRDQQQDAAQLAQREELVQEPDGEDECEKGGGGGEHGVGGHAGVRQRQVEGVLCAVPQRPHLQRSAARPAAGRVSTFAVDTAQARLEHLVKAPGRPAKAEVAGQPPHQQRCAEELAARHVGDRILAALRRKRLRHGVAARRPARHQRRLLRLAGLLGRRAAAQTQVQVIDGQVDCRADRGIN